MGKGGFTEFGVVGNQADPVGVAANNLLCFGVVIIGIGNAVFYADRGQEINAMSTK